VAALFWGGGGGWGVGVVESKFSDHFGYSLRLALAKPNNINKICGQQRPTQVET
jgi:hypothetical protein